VTLAGWGSAAGAALGPPLPALALVLLGAAGLGGWAGGALPAAAAALLLLLLLLGALAISGCLQAPRWQPEFHSS
jgi:hypothetical protein